MGPDSRRCCCLLTLFLSFLSFPGCGGSPTTPSSPAASSPPVVVAFGPGSYYLSVSNGSGSITGPGGETFHTWLCLGIGSYPNTVQVPVDVRGEGRAFTLHAVAGSLTGDLFLEGTAVGGTLRGGATDETGTFSLSAGTSEPASVSGTVTGDRAIGGTVVAGTVTLAGPNGSGGCSPATWRLTPR